MFHFLMLRRLRRRASAHAALFLSRLSLCSFAAFAAGRVAARFSPFFIARLRPLDIFAAFERRRFSSFFSIFPAVFIGFRQDAAIFASFHQLTVISPASHLLFRCHFDYAPP